MHDGREEPVQLAGVPAEGSGPGQLLRGDGAAVTQEQQEEARQQDLCRIQHRTVLLEGSGQSSGSSKCLEIYLEPWLRCPGGPH